MKTSAASLCLLLLALPVMLHAEKKALSLEEICLSDKFEGEFLSQPQWHPDNKSFIYLETGDDEISSLYRHDLQTGEETIFLDGHDLTAGVSDKPISLDEYCLSNSGSKVLIHTDTASIWRRSDKSRCLIYNFATHEIQPVHDGDEAILNVKFSPDDTRVGYVLNNDIYTRDLETCETRRWTNDGSDIIINGTFDWAYEEEFGVADGWMWSPDGKKIAFWQLDQSRVPEFSWIDYNPVHQEITTIRYPKAGDSISQVQIGVIDLESETTVWMNIGEETDIYIPRIQWTESSEILSIQRLNRGQNKLELLLADVRTGKTTIALTDADPCYVDIHDNLNFLENGDFIWTSERDGFNHIYLCDSGGEICQITSGEWEVSEVYGVDEQNGLVYFAANKEHFTETHVYTAELNSGPVTKLSPEPGSHYACFSDDFRFFIDEYSDAITPQKTALRNADGSAVRIVRENNLEILDEYAFSHLELFTIQTSDNASLDAFMIKPADFDPDKKYPVLVYCYGGPYGQSVKNKWAGDRWTNWNLRMNYFVQKGYIVFCVDGRGVGGRGKADKNLVHKNLAKWAVHDQIEGAKYLAGLPFVDKDRIGIYGWSFGGYLTLLAMTIGADYFSVGVCGAPSADWELYDAIYTERFMMQPDENPEGYRAAAAYTHIDKLKGKLLLIHGTADDNVHVQNTMQYIERLQNTGKPFDLMLYPGKAHGITGKETTLHLWTTIFDFITENL